MTYPFPEPPSSVPDLMAELSRVKAAIRRTRKPVLPGGDEVTADDLFRLYARERAVVRRLRCRYRQWRAEIGISDAAALEIGTVGTSGTAVSYKGVTLAPHPRISMEGKRVAKSRLDADPGLEPSYDQAPSPHAV